jgi:uncharacterized protein DUF177 involved in 23S rRNA accumulation
MNEAPPFRRPVRVEAIPREGLETRIEADEAERAALAAFNGLPAIGRLVATFGLKHAAGGVIIVRGEVAADVTQTCVVTLEPFAASLVEPIDLRFAPPSEAISGRASDEGAELDNEERPDPIVHGKIDLGALAAEFLTLGLDPYPRKPGVAFEAPKDKSDTPSASPFGALAQEKKGD